MGDYGVAGDDYEGAPVFDDDSEEAPVFDDDHYEEESMPVCDIDIEDIIVEEEGFVGKRGFGGEEDNIEDFIVVANDLCYLLTQTSINVDFSKTVDSNPHELIWLQKGMINVANEFNVPIYVFFTSNAAFLGFILHLKTRCDDQNQDVIELSNSDTVITIPNISIPRLYPVGPILNLNAGAGKPSDDGIIGWLDSQLPSSVVIVCFGSMGSFDAIQVKEIVHALEQSVYHFLWSLRRPPSDQTSRSPSDYEDLGVKSLLESLWFGVPLATWPIFAKQQINAFEMVVELGLSVEIKLDYRKNSNNHKAHTVIETADEIESGIRRLMKDNDIKTKVKETSKKSRAAVAEGGSSYTSVGCLIQDFIRNLT
nr:hypothetical protein [Tanacetum cinerariifolium]